MNKQILPRYPLVSYFVMAYTITWSGVLLVAGLRGFDPRRIGITEGVL